MRAVSAAGVLACLVWLCPASAQARGEASWTWALNLSSSFVVTGSDWSISHPYYGGGGVTWETLSGTFTQRALLQGGVELRKKYFGLRGNLGILPQRFTQDTPVQDNDLTLVLAGFAAVLYPTAGAGKNLEPYVAVGVGGQKATGDMDNSGFYISGSAGILIELVSRIALDAGVQIHRLKYTQIDITPTIQQDVRICPVSMVLGARIRV